MMCVEQGQGRAGIVETESLFIKQPARDRAGQVFLRAAVHRRGC